MPGMDEQTGEYVPFDARKAMQEAIWNTCIRPADNEWTTWTDSIALAEAAAEGLRRAGFKVTEVNASNTQPTNDTEA